MARISRRTAVNALHEGIDARQAGKPVASCPYVPYTTLSDQFQAIWWIKGWRRAGTLEAEVPQV